MREKNYFINKSSIKKLINCNFLFTRDPIPRKVSWSVVRYDVIMTSKAIQKIINRTDCQPVRERYFIKQIHGINLYSYLIVKIDAL